jgi:hypothetical protein
LVVDVVGSIGFGAALESPLVHMVGPRGPLRVGMPPSARLG